MAIIGFGAINKDLIAIIIGSIFCFLNRLLNIFVEAKLFNNKILTNIFISIANIFTIIPYLISERRGHSRPPKRRSLPEQRAYTSDHCFS